MKIRGWAIQLDGIRDSAASDLPDGLTVVHGANESGKTLLLELLAGILFGMSDANDTTGERREVAEHPARGQLVVDDGTERIVVERVLDRQAPPVLRRPDGSTADPERLRHVLGRADERLFRAAFACGLDDLRSLGALDLDGVRDVLFSATLAAYGRSARAAILRLREEAGPRLNGDGSGQINRLIGELNALRPRLNAARHAALAYGDRRAAADRAAAAAAAQREVLSARQAAREYTAALLRAWPAWQALQAVRAELAALESADALSDELEAEIRSASARLRAAEAALTARRVEYAEAGNAEPPPASVVLPVGGAEIEALCADLPLHRFHLATLPGLRARCAETQRRLNDHLQRSAADWSIDRLRAWATAAHDRDRARDGLARARAAADQVQQARWRWEAAQALSAAARRERDGAAAEAVAPAGPDAEEIARRRRAVAEMRTAKKEMLARRARAEAMAQALRDQLLARGAHSADGPPWPPPWLAPALAGGAIGAGAAALWWLGMGVPLFGLSAIVLAGVASAAARYTRRWQHASVARHEQQQSARRPLDGEIDAAQRMHEAELHRATVAGDRLARHAQSIGLPRSPSAAQIAEYERTLDEAAAADGRAAFARTHLAELEAARCQREAEEEARAGDLAAAAAAYTALEREWTAWAAAAGFGANTVPDQVLERIAALEAAQGALAAFETAAREICQAESTVAEWETRARAALVPLRTAGDEHLNGAPLIERVLAVRLRVQHDGPEQARRAARLEEMRARAGRLEAAEAEAAHCRRHVASLLRASGASDEAELDRRQAVAERRRNLQRAAAEHDLAIRELLGEQPAADVLASGEVEAWQHAAAAADAEIHVLERDLDRLVAEEQRAASACRELEQSAAVASLEAEWNALMAELGEAVHDWRALAAAIGLVEEAWATFERDHQSPVLRAASEIFASVTGGRYERIVQDERAAALLVRDGDRWKQVEDLSRSTREQLYLSVRLGLAQELARRGVALPLVLDDVLVNFDSERARRMAASLAAVARRQQVLFLTCHTELRDVLVHFGLAARVIEL